VLRFSGERPREKRLALLWPAWQWQVVVPVHNAQLDLIERTVLGLLATKWLDTAQLARVLALDESVVELVLERLQVDGFLAAAGVTAQGIAQLGGDGGGDRDEELATWFVYHDPFRDVLWRHAAPDRPSEHEVRVVASDRVALAGSRGEKDNEELCHVVAPPVGAPKLPAAIDVLQAIRASEPDVGSAANTALVSFPHDTPQRVFLRVYVYRASHGFADRAWEVANPFGVGLLPGMRASVELAMTLMPWLEEEIRQSLGLGRRRPTATGGPGSAVGDRPLDDLVAVHRAVEQRVLDLADDAPRRRGILEGEIRELDRLRESIGSCAADALAFSIDGRPARPWLDVDRSTRAQSVRRLAEQLGFDCELPGSVSSSTRQDVEAALAGESRSLRALILAALFSAHEHRDHPLRVVVADAADLPAVLLRIAEGREHGLEFATEDRAVAAQRQRLLGDVRDAVRVLAPLLAELGQSADPQAGRALSRGSVA
jgi:hypothetical protein